jgi:hypothetical protein
MKRYTVQPLNRSQLHCAYPLIRLALPTLDLPTWSRFARRIADPCRARRSGIMVAQRESRPYPSGLFCYRNELDLKYGFLLTVDHFIALDIIDYHPVANALIAALEALAQRLHCNAIRSLMHVGSEDVEPSLLAAGYRIEGTTLLKRLDPAGAGVKLAEPDRPILTLASA